jgi:hypothetical protein
MVVTNYPEAFKRELNLTKAGYAVRRTEVLDVNGVLSKRGVDTILFEIWKRKGKVTAGKQRGRKPKK